MCATVHTSLSQIKSCFLFCAPFIHFKCSTDATSTYFMWVLISFLQTVFCLQQIAKSHEAAHLVYSTTQNQSWFPKAGEAVLYCSSCLMQQNMLVISNFFLVENTLTVINTRKLAVMKMSVEERETLLCLNCHNWVHSYMYILIRCLMFHSNWETGCWY